MSTCPKGSFLSGNKCLPYLTCHRIKLNIKTQTVFCSECTSDAVSLFLQLIPGYLAADFPTPEIAYYGKCYEACPLTSEDEDQKNKSSSGGDDGEDEDEEDDDDGGDDEDSTSNKSLFCKTSCPLSRPFVT